MQRDKARDRWLQCPWKALRLGPKSGGRCEKSLQTPTSLMGPLPHPTKRLKVYSLQKVNRRFLDYRGPDTLKHRRNTWKFRKERWESQSSSSVPREVVSSGAKNTEQPPHSDYPSADHPVPGPWLPVCNCGRRVFLGTTHDLASCLP